MNYQYLKNNQFKYATITNKYGTFTRYNDNIYSLNYNSGRQYMTYIQNNIPLPLIMNAYKNDFNVEVTQSKYVNNINDIINPFINCAIEIRNPSEIQTSAITIILSNNDVEIEKQYIAIDPIEPKVYTYVNISCIRYEKFTFTIDTIFTGSVILRIVGDRTY